MTKPNPKFMCSQEEAIALLEKWLGGCPLTLRETSSLLGIAPSAVKAIEVRALSKMKSPLKKKGITKIDDVIDASKFRTAIEANT